MLPTVPLFWFLLALLLSSCTTPPDQVVLAKVGREKIPAAELQRIFSEQADLYGEDLLSDPEGNFAVKKKLLNSLVEKRLLLQIAHEKKISLTPEEEQSVVKRLTSGYNSGELEKILEGKKILFDEWVGQQKEKRLIEKLIDQEVYSKIQPPPGEIEDHYKKNRHLYREPDRIRCRHIVTGKEEKARTILSLLNKGENFAAVAKKYSESPDRENGGDLGFLARGEYPAVFEQACFTLATGQTSDVVPSPYGFHIFRVVDKRPGRQIPLKEAAPQIVERLRGQKGKMSLKEWLDQLHRNHKITIDEEALKEGVFL